MSPVDPQCDFKLYLLRQKYLRASKGSFEMHEAKKQLDDEIAHREHMDQKMKRMIDGLFGSKNASTMMPETQRPAGKPGVDDWDCSKNILKSYGAHCGKMSEYGLKYTRAMANMCSAGIRAEQFASVAEVVCGGSN